LTGNNARSPASAATCRRHLLHGRLLSFYGVSSPPAALGTAVVDSGVSGRTNRT